MGILKDEDVKTDLIKIDLKVYLPYDVVHHKETQTKGTQTR